VKVPNADTCASSEFDWVVIEFCSAAPYSLVSAETIALILSPDPMPVEVTVAADAVDGVADDEEDVDVIGVVVLVVGEVLLEMLELMMLVPFQSMTLSATALRT